MWTRTHVKKIIMNIPYNASLITMVEYLKNELNFCGYDITNKCYWYSDGFKHMLK